MGNIDNSFDYCRGYSDGFQEGYNKALEHFNNKLQCGNTNYITFRIDSENPEKIKNELDRYLKNLKL